MRKAATIIFAAALFFAAGCSTVPTRKAERALSFQEVKIGGVNYVPAMALAGYYGMQWHWDPFVKKAELFKGGFSFIFHVGIDYALVNGGLEKLSHSPALYDGAVVIPADFANRRMANMLSPPQKAAKAPLPQKYFMRKIVIDAGHGGKDPGALSGGGLREKDVVLDISRRVRDELSGNGISVVLTRDRDRFVSLSRRADIANSNDVDLFVSVHANAARQKNVNGFEVYYLSDAVDDSARAVETAENAFLKFDDASFYLRNANLEATLWDLVYTENREESVELAKCVAESVGDFTSLRNRGVRSARFYVLKGVRMPSILVEVGYLSNPGEEENMRQPSFRKEMASAIARGILNYKTIYESTDGFTR